MTEIKKEICKYCVKGWINVSIIIQDDGTLLIDDKSEKSRFYAIPCLCSAGENLVKNFKAVNNMEIRKQAFKIAKYKYAERCASYFADPKETMLFRKNLFKTIWEKLGRKHPEKKVFV